MKTILINGVEVTAPRTAMMRFGEHTWFAPFVMFQSDIYLPDIRVPVEIGRAS